MSRQRVGEVKSPGKSVCGNQNDALLVLRASHECLQAKTGSACIENPGLFAWSQSKTQGALAVEGAKHRDAILNEQQVNKAYARLMYARSQAAQANRLNNATRQYCIILADLLAQSRQCSHT